VAVKQHRSWLCRFNLRHDWQSLTTEDGQREYVICRRCGKGRPGGLEGPHETWMLYAGPK